ncbi:MAG: Bifunctional oligoribonuclease and PAP phosphatase NrnA [bacterium ADurb.Bin212]|nr:MAG: Bifunctional oligoribonuclease and PAP phosphatase NrnA [bacterium ADurb.Bin212]
MELSPKQQVVERVREAEKILITTHKNPDGDAIGATLALLLFLKKMGKKVTAVTEDMAPDVFNYLPSFNEVSQNFAGARDFVISVDISKVKADKIMYKVLDDKLNIIITPKNGQFKDSMVSYPAGSFNYDLIIVLDSPDLERMGVIYDKNPDVFFETPVINIDHHAGNDHFGQVNLVDLTATSTSEILVSILEALSPEKSPFNEDIATCLLTGIITDTGSFQNANTTPKSLTVSAQMVAAGARRDEIIKRVYKTRSLSTLRLWGRALVNIHDEKADGFVWSSLSKNDFVQVSANENESGGVIDELLKTVSGAEFVLLLSEKAGGVSGSLRAVEKGMDVSKIAKIFGGGGHAMAAGFEINNTTLEESSPMIIQRIKENRQLPNGQFIVEEGE